MHEVDLIKERHEVDLIKERPKNLSEKKLKQQILKHIHDIVSTGILVEFFTNTQIKYSLVLNDKKVKDF